jgi:sirohydrochlorin ferrochelatase
VALGPGAQATLRSFAAAYLEVFSPELARTLSEAMPLHTPERLRELLDAVAAAGCDEFIVVPATSDPAMLDELAAVVAG